MADQIYLPVGSPLVRHDTLNGTDAMIGWMRQITKAVPGPASGGAAPANAFYVVSAPDGSLTNARVATSTATVTVDTSVANIIKWNALGANVFKASVTITDAQIKALPTTPIVLVAAQGIGTRIVPLAVDLNANFTAGAYTNVDANGFLFGIVGVSDAQTGFIGNDSSVPFTFLSVFLSALHQGATLLPYNYAEPVNQWGNLAFLNTLAASLNASMTLVLDNGASGNLTGGNAANTLIATTYYGVVS